MRRFAHVAGLVLLVASIIVLLNTIALSEPGNVSTIQSLLFANSVVGLMLGFGMVVWGTDPYA